LRIALLYDVMRLDEKLLLSRLRERGSVEAIHVPSSVIPLSLDGSSLSFDVAVERCISFYRAASTAFALEAYGVRVVNSGFSIAASGDKVWSLSLLHKHGVPVPRTLLAFTVEGAVEAAERLGYPVILKPIVGSWGRLQALADEPEDVRVVAEHREYMGGPYKIHYVQEYIRKPGRDIRAVCIGDSVPAAIYRVSSHWITNTARGGKAVPAKVDGELEDIVLRACNALGVEVGGVDVVEDPDRGYLVLEVNAVPEFKNIMAVTGVDVAGAIAEYIVSQARR
jgi:[lysine-biosynthesis-protein LysW]--L-2-aminoadipate ligase